MKARGFQIQNVGMWLGFAMIAVPFGVRAQSQPVVARHGMVVTTEPLATEVGVAILRQGGNAFDAAAAVGFALAVTYPQAGNLGGGGFCVALKNNGETFALDMRETAPAAAHRDMYLDEKGEVMEGMSLASHLAVGVPGTVDGLLRLQADHGVLDRAAILAPAIELAESGFEVSFHLRRDLESHRETLVKYPATAAVFFPAEQPPAFGERLRQSDLARTLRRIQKEGRAGFYEGLTADMIVAEMGKYGGVITADDLKRYEAKYREPLRISWGGYQLVTHPLPSSGGVTLAQILGLLDAGQLKHTPHNGADYVSLLVEAERLAYADRNHHLGDGDFVQVPVKELMSDTYLAGRRALLPTGSEAGSSLQIRPGKITSASPESEETTHYCVADAAGNVVAITTTLNAWFGMGAVVDGAGFLLNNEMDDFSAKPGVPNLYGLIGGEANAIAPGKRMLSSMTPTIVLRNHRFMMTMGSPGGGTIITTVLQIFLNRAVWGMNIRDAIDAPRFHHQWLPDNVIYEPRAMGWETMRELAVRGYPLIERESIGVAAGIEATPEGYYAGHADRRGPGTAGGY